MWFFSKKKNQRTCSKTLVDYYCINVTQNYCLPIILITENVFKHVFMMYMMFDNPCKPPSMRLLTLHFKSALWSPLSPITTTNAPFLNPKHATMPMLEVFYCTWDIHEVITTSDHVCDIRSCLWFSWSKCFSPSWLPFLKKNMFKLVFPDKN